MSRVSRILFCVLTILVPLGSVSAVPEQGFGEVAFKNSGPAAAQADFLLGLAQLHDFEYDAAASHFRKAQQIAPDFALAFWGEAMTKNHAVWHEEDLPAAREILNRLAPTPEARLAKAPTEREKLYLRSVEVLFGDGAVEERHRRHESVLADLRRQFPDDVDATTFYALAILGTAEHGRDFTTYMRAAAVLEEVFPQHSRHPGVVHYLIHSYDDPVHAPLGLRAARIYSQIAPEAAHAQHMTSHIFLALGMWDEEVKANETAMVVVNAPRLKAGKRPAMCFHINEWLEYGYLQQGRVDDARRMVEGCRQSAQLAVEAAAKAPPASSSTMSGMMGAMSPAMATVASYADMRAQFLINSQLWNDEVARWSLPAGDYPLPQLTLDYTNAIVAFKRGDLEAAREAVSRAENDQQHAKTWTDQHKINEPQMDAAILITIEQLHALLAAAQGKTDDAVKELQRVAAKEHQLPLEFGPPSIEKPTDELLGELLLQLNRPAEARAAFQAALARTPGRRLVLDEIARADKQLATATAANDSTKPPSTGTSVHKH